MADRYLLLRHNAADRFIGLAGRPATDDDKKWLLERGFSNGICYAADEATRGFDCPVRSAVDNGMHVAARFLLFRAIASQLSVRFRLKKHSLHSLLSRLEAQRPHTGCHDVQYALAIAAAFERSKHYLPSQNQCLPRALAMTGLLFRRGINAQLIFGVTMPFSAHCWVQLGSMVLTDPLDRILPFRPILVMS